MVGTRRLEQLAGSLVDRLCLPEGEPVVALSGGADSAALAMLCRRAGLEVRAVHVNHGLPNSTTMESAARAVARRLDLELLVLAVDVPAGPSPEGQARRARYSAFSKAVAAGDALLTGHTMDDQVETVVFNMIRGTGARGLAGIPYHRPPSIYRPMLDVTRSEARELAALESLPYFDDPMNDDMSLSRNVVRTRIIPALAEMNPRLMESVSRLADSIAADNRFLESQAAGVEVIVSESGAAVAIGTLFAAPEPIRDRILKELISRSVGSSAVTADRVRGLWEVASGSTDGIEVGEGAIARRSRSQLVITGVNDRNEGTSIRLQPGRVRQGRLQFETASFDRVCMVAPLSKWQAVFPLGTSLDVDADGTVNADGVPAWIPGVKRLPVAFYEAGTVGYLSVRAFEEAVWTSNH